MTYDLNLWPWYTYQHDLLEIIDNHDIVTFVEDQWDIFSINDTLRNKTSNDYYNFETKSE
jgi:hypothetical protein